VQVSLALPVAEITYSGDSYHSGLVAEWFADWRVAWAAAVPLHPGERQRLEYSYRFIGRCTQPMPLFRWFDCVLCRGDLE
jgi:hypothetical protein